MSVIDIKDDGGIECSWWEGKRLRTKIFKPKTLIEGQQPPTTINVSFVKASRDDRSENEDE